LKMSSPSSTTFNDLGSMETPSTMPPLFSDGSSYSLSSDRDQFVMGDQQLYQPDSQNHGLAPIDMGMMLPRPQQSHHNSSSSSLLQYPSTSGIPNPSSSTLPYPASSDLQYSSSSQLPYPGYTPPLTSMNTVNTLAPTAYPAPPLHYGVSMDPYDASQLDNPM
ncbi:hypothetical protein PFISCL1PPCAC_1032, partial [Pristionchus fissidentatus]